MTLSASHFGAAFLLGALLLSGCLPSGQSALDEEKEPHFLTGKSRVSGMDFRGAIEAFEKALEVNPKSAAAHFELAILFEKNETDAAAAIYHYDQYLKLRPRADNAEIVRQHITSCKQVLARTVSLGPVTERQQREFEALADENKKLHEEVEKWKLSASRSQGATNTAGPAQSSRDSREAAVLARATQNSGSGFSAGAVESSAAGASRPASVSPPATRIYMVKAGDTPTMIARKHGVKLDALMAANPRLDPRRLQVGQSLTIPPP